MGLIYLDSSVVLDALESGSVRHSQVSTALRATSSDEPRVSDLVRLECLVHAPRQGDPIRLADVRAFFEGVATLPMISGVFDDAAALRANRKGLKTPDALHLATALRHGCAEFWTNDLDLAKIPASLTFRTF